ncbi:MAG: hypothetical protein RLZZ28_1101 [Bacteroidota bacterium]|jgi:ComF family protein
MGLLAKKYIEPFVSLLFPHCCEGCGSTHLSDKQFLCAACIHQLPVTGFFELPGNEVEKTFYGRLPIAQAGALYYFTKESLLQYLLIQLKYKGNREAGYFLGRMLGHSLKLSRRYCTVDVLVPLPLHSKKEKIRGYNQAAIICQGINEIWHKPVAENIFVRQSFTDTQTRQNRVNRWQNMEGVFTLQDTKALENQHILLIDDVITTGATLEACGSLVNLIPGAKLSIGAVGYTG